MSTITYKGRDFLIDGKPIQIYSGAMHYWRIVPEYWEDRLKKLKYCGFNTVETYVPWNLHERKEGTFDFSGGLDIIKYIETARKLGLYVIVRPGPYICSEFDFGGLPSWLLKYKDVALRCNNETYLEKVDNYLKALLTKLKPYLITNGGNIIMIQIENEYGSYGDDKEYLNKIADMYKKYGIDCLYYTSDGACDWMLNGGTLPQYLCVANFGSHPQGDLERLEEFRPGQPLMCGEFWCGWFDHWGEKHHTRPADDTMESLIPLINNGCSFNVYMFHGGTNFGFTNGANHTGEEYQPTITSYDYCAPLSEAGDMTPTFFEIRNYFKREKGIDNDIKCENSKKKAYGKVTLTEAAKLFDNVPAISEHFHHATPQCMEDLGQDFGYIVYSTTVKGAHKGIPLYFEHIHDRANVYFNGKLVGIRERSRRKDEIELPLSNGEEGRLDILVENCGRVNYGPKLYDRKGIFDNVVFGQQFHYGWDMYTMPMEDLLGLKYTDNTENDGMPTFLKGEFEIKEKADTFIRLDGFKKGFVMINGFNLGRYWNELGPQKTLYVPAPILKEGKNEIVVFESDGYEKPVVEFFDTPDLG